MYKALVPVHLVIEYLLIIKLKFNSYRRKLIPTKWKTGNKGNIVLIPGVHCNWQFMKEIGDLVNEIGYKVYIVKGLQNNTFPIKDGVDLLESTLLNNNLKNVILICHSKGGIIAKYFLDKSKYKKNIKKVISIATPYKGSWLAYLINSQEQTPNSSLIKFINTNSQNSLITNLYPTFDNHVVPNKNLLLQGANNIQINVIGHTRILTSTKTHDKIREILQNEQ